jgi:uncharacterized protein YyaL (SSP411 family)
VNRLASATSPYLLQHADNPVAWWQWDPEAFAEAQRRDVPVLISVGYASCHWCHVMAHESFEDGSVAAVVNELVVPIKVDREERPDVDAVYMSATQAMTGQGGWPMTVFATPTGEPFFCGTYYPREAFLRLVRAVSDAWKTQRGEVVKQGAAVVEAIADAGVRSGGIPTGTLTAELLDSAAASLVPHFDTVHGGFGAAPKFPPHMALLFLLRHHQRTSDPTSLEMVRATGEAMARGGMYDQLAGGFARYSTDERWLVPHFEKMLYDNALLLRAYTLLWRLTGDALAARVAAETVEFLLRDLSVDGGFASALDADTAGVEGLTYAWTPAQLSEVLGAGDGAFAADLFGVTAAGTFEHGTSVLRLTRDIDDAGEAGRRRWRDVRQRLYDARAQRPQPARDDKVVAAWNGLAIVALVEFSQTARALAAHDGLAAQSDAAALYGLAAQAGAAAREAAGLLARVHLVDGRLRRVSRHGQAGDPVGVLEDYGVVAEAFCAMHQLTAEGEWLDRAGGLLDAALNHFGDGEGGFFDTADDAERLVTRPSDPTDNATPSGLSTMVAALTAYSALAGQPRYREAATAALDGVAGLIRGHARFAGYAGAAGEALLSGPYEIAIAGTDGALTAAAWRLAPPGAVVVSGAPDAAGVPLLAGRPLREGQPTAYVCRGFVCDRPVTTVDELAAQLASG